MPFKSEAQRRFMFMEHPAIAKRWAHEFPGQKDLPYHAAMLNAAKKRKGKQKKK